MAACVSACEGALVAGRRRIGWEGEGERVERGSVGAWERGSEGARERGCEGVEGRDEGGRERERGRTGRERARWGEGGREGVIRDVNAEMRTYI